MKPSLRSPDLPDGFLAYAAQFGVTHIRATVEALSRQMNAGE
jgi:hypothetical protein